MGYWWCLYCEEVRSPQQVTYLEKCDICGDPVESYEDGEGPAYEQED